MSFMMQARIETHNNVPEQTTKFVPYLVCDKCGSDQHCLVGVLMHVYVLLIGTLRCVAIPADMQLIGQVACQGKNISNWAGGRA